MKREFPLKPLLDLSQLRLDEAGRKLGKLIAGEQEASQRHKLLTDYRDDYSAKFVAAAQNGLSPSEWKNYSSFLARLDEAIAQAESAMVHTKQRTLAGQQEWLSKRGRLKAFDTLSERHQSKLSYQDQRSEQKESDGHAARRHTPTSGSPDKENDSDTKP